MAEALLKAEGLWLSYGPFDAVKGVSIDVRTNEVVALLGPNGSGKSTLLRGLCGLHRPKAGHVRVTGGELDAMRPDERARSIAFVPQSEDHAFGFTVRELALMGRYVWSRGLFESDSDRKVAESAMADTDCLQFADRPLTTLSGGEAQRALIARALAQQAPVLLCDEPNTHLDPGHQARSVGLFRRLRTEGRGILVTSHDLNWAFAVCDRAVFLKCGEVVYEGTPEEAVQAKAHEDAFDTTFDEVDVNGRTFLVPREPD
ncbi:MAG: ABC transporter ATP-binding protein [Armatimonadetes bacterium]|nr:ABC transporter ATP-binding protein [Armatimonadota bacterium]